MNALQFASSINASASHVLAGACEHVSIHVAPVAAGFAVTVFDERAQELHQLPTLPSHEAAQSAVWQLRDAFYAATGER